MLEPSRGQGECSALQVWDFPGSNDTISFLFVSSMEYIEEWFAIPLYKIEAVAQTG